MANRKVSQRVSFLPPEPPVIVIGEDGRPQVVSLGSESEPGSPADFRLHPHSEAIATRGRRISNKVSFSSLNPPQILMGKDGRFQVTTVEPVKQIAAAELAGVVDDESSEEEDEIEKDQLSVSRYAKTMSQLSEVGPKYENFGGESLVDRPGMEELHLGISKEKEQKPEEEKKVLKGKVVKFTWLEGVLMRCLLNIWGVMLFIRLSWVIGQAGIIQGLLAISWANITTLITAISMSAVASNGQIKGGGIYFMISRSLGPEFGGAIGLLFTVANSIAVALHIVGFCESMRDFLLYNGWGEIVDGAENDTRIVGVGVLVFILILAFVGMDWVTRTQMLMLVILVAAQVNFVVGSIIGPVDDLERAKGFVGYDAKLLEENLWAGYSKGVGKDDTIHDFFSVFGVFFPAVTGIVAGANLSGDLKDPATAIPKGTLLAIAITYVGYISYGVMMGASTLREASGLIDNTTGLMVPCDVVKCTYGLVKNYQVMELISSWGPLIYMGCFAASLSSAIASLVGAPRVLQALAKDKLYPKIDFFAKGYGANNDPVRGYVLVFCIAFGCVMIANLNMLAPLLSNIFLTAYCLINFSCFHATITKSPGWRPAFKYYNAWLSLLGSLLCLVAMFLMNYITGLITVVITMMLYMYLLYYKPKDINWGSSTQASAYNSALKSVMELNSVHEHTKNYRPQILVLSGFPSSRPALVDFGYLITKEVSLIVSAHVVRGPVHGLLRRTLTRQATEWLTAHKKKSFYSMTEGDTLLDGAISLIQNVGLGKLRPNMVLLGYKNDWETCDRLELLDYYGVINQVFRTHLSLGILRVKGGLDYSNIIFDEGQSTINTHDIEKRGTKNEGFVSDGDLTANNNNSTTAIDAAAEAEAQRVAEFKKKRSRKISHSAMYKGPSGPLPRDISNNITQFRRKKSGLIDVWWLYDDGGLTLLVPYLLTLRSQFAKCKLRIFTLCSAAQELGREQRNMALLLSKLRIEYSDIIIITDIAKTASESTKNEFDRIIGPFKSAESTCPECHVMDSDLSDMKEKTNRHLRLRELLLEHSMDAALIVMTTLVPRASSIPAPIYMAWLEMVTRGMPPFLLIRGNQESVLTFYA